jgi:hypothetical protein
MVTDAQQNACRLLDDADLLMDDILSALRRHVGKWIELHRTRMTSKAERGLLTDLSAPSMSPCYDGHHHRLKSWKKAMNSLADVFRVVFRHCGLVEMRQARQQVALLLLDADTALRGLRTAVTKMQRHQVCVDSVTLTSTAVVIASPFQLTDEKSGCRGPPSPCMPACTHG